MAGARHTISSQIRHIIEARGFTPTEVAERAGVDRAGVSRFLAGKRGLTLATADRIAAAFHLRLIEDAPPAPRGRPRGRPAEG
jgi:transcriptional regulator with XRE-family HTH domain